MSLILHLIISNLQEENGDNKNEPSQNSNEDENDVDGALPSEN